MSNWIERKLQDPPPEYFFEITSEGLAWQCALPSPDREKRDVGGTGLIAAPARPNITAIEAYREILSEVAGRIEPGRNRAAVAIPDYAVRVAILDFDAFPADEEEALALIRFRLRKAVPFAIQDARLSYTLRMLDDGRAEVLTVAIANAVLEEYEGLFTAGGFRVGLVIPSSLAAMSLLRAPAEGLSAVMSLQGAALSIFLMDGERLRLFRCVDLAGEGEEAQKQADHEAVLSVLQQTMAYADDQIGTAVAQVWVCGFGAKTGAIATAVTESFALPCEELRDGAGERVDGNIGLPGLLAANGSSGINIASQPFQQERRKKAVLWASCAGLSCTLLVMTAIILHTLFQTQHLRRELAEQTSVLNQLEMAQSRSLRMLAEPKNADVFAWSVLLNELLAHRGLSWARVFEDLSKVLPPDMRLVGIRVPQVTAEDSRGVNRVQLDMVVATENPKTLLDLLNALQTSELFGSATVLSQTAPTQDDPSCKFRVLVRYGQKI